MLLPTATQNCVGIWEGSPISSPVLGVEVDRTLFTAVQLTSKTETLLLSRLPLEYT